MGVTENSIIHRTWQLIPCINTLDTKVQQCSQLVYFSYNYDLLLQPSLTFLQLYFYLLLPFYLYCLPLHVIICVCQVLCSVSIRPHLLYMLLFLQNSFYVHISSSILNICLTAWLSQYWFSYIFLCVCTFIILPASVYLSLHLWLIACQFLSLSFTLL